MSEVFCLLHASELLVACLASLGAPHATPAARSWVADDQPSIPRSASRRPNLGLPMTWHWLECTGYCRVVVWRET